MAATQSSAWSAALRFTVQKQILETLRNDLIWIDSSLARQGTFEEGSDQLLFESFPDLSFTSPLTPLTEGTAPSVDAISMNTTLVTTAQYGRSVGLTDVAKRLNANAVRVVAEKAARQAKEVINRVTRTAVFTGGTPFYPSADHSTRATLDNTDFMTAAFLMQLRAKMKLANIPTFADGSYKVFLNTKVAYDLRAETTAHSGWLDVSQYTESGRSEIMRGEIGKFHGMRIIEANDTPTFSGSGITVQAGVAVGDVKGWACGDLMTLQTFHTPASSGGQTDHGDPAAQNELVSWKVMFGCAPVNNTYYYRIESYATAL